MPEQPGPEWGARGAAALLEGRAWEWSREPKALGFFVKDTATWWDTKPPAIEAVKARIQTVHKLIAKYLPEMRVALVGHSYWLKVATPCSARAKGTPSPLGCAAGYWPKNSTLYLGELAEKPALGFRVKRKLDLETGTPGVKALKEAYAESSAGKRRQVVLIRHAQSEGQVARKEAKDLEASGEGGAEFLAGCGRSNRRAESAGC